MEDKDLRSQFDGVYKASACACMDASFQWRKYSCALVCWTHNCPPGPLGKYPRMRSNTGALVSMPYELKHNSWLVLTLTFLSFITMNSEKLIRFFEESPELIAKKESKAMRSLMFKSGNCFKITREVSRWIHYNNVQQLGKLVLTF